MRIVSSTGSLPRFPRRGITFFANLRSLFFGNIDQTEILVREIRGISHYGGRLATVLGLLYPSEDNVLVLEQNPPGEALEYFRRLSLSLPKMVSPDDAIVSLHENPAPSVDGFVTDTSLEELAARHGKSTINTQQGCRDANNKVLLYLHLQEAGLPTMDTFLISSPEEFDGAAAELRGLGYERIVVKSAIGASGCGLWIHSLKGPHARPPAYLFHEKPCMVQGWLDDTVVGVSSIGSPSVQVFVHDDSVWLYDLTEQYLSRESIHEGNVAPPPYLAAHPGLEEEILEQAGEIGRFIHATGYRGTAGIDFIAVMRHDGPHVYACEVNARVTGATYPALLARHFRPESSWLMRNVSFDDAPSVERILGLLERNGILYFPGRDEGILPFNFNFEDDTLVKSQFLVIAPERSRCDSLLAKTCDLLGTRRFARD